MEASLLKYFDESQTNKTEKVALHKANSVCLYLVCTYDSSKNIYYGRM